MPYEVQHYTLAYGWINTWSYAEADGVFRPESFPTHGEAQAALDEYLQDLAEEAAAGHVATYDRSEFRVHYVPDASDATTTNNN